MHKATVQTTEQSTEQSTAQSTEQSTVQSKEQSTVQPTELSTAQPTEQSTVQSNDTYIYGVGILAVLTQEFVYFLHITALRLQIKNKYYSDHRNDVICFRNIQ